MSPANKKRSSPAKPTKPGTLAGIALAKEILGVPSSTINRWLERSEMPQPIDVLSAGPVWRRRDLERFATKRERQAESS
jgi:hypothetical protein